MLNHPGPIYAQEKLRQLRQGELALAQLHRELVRAAAVEAPEAVAPKGRRARLEWRLPYFLRLSSR